MKLVKGLRAASLQDRLVWLVLAMAAVTALIAAPVSMKSPAVVPLVLEGFAILLLGAILVTAKWDLRSADVKLALRSGTGIAALALFGLALVSCIFSHTRVVSLQGALQIGIGVLLYFIVSHQFRRTHQLTRFTNVIILVSIVGAVIGCAEYGTNPDIQATGLFGDHQLYGSFLMVLLPFLAVSAMTEKVVNRQLAAQTATVLTTIALLLAHSRSAWIGAASGLVAIGLMSALIPARGRQDLDAKRKLLVPGLLMAAGVAFFLLLSPMSASLLNRANTLASMSSQEAWKDRQSVWHGALKMISDHPLTGVGASSYAFSHNAYTGLSSPIAQLHARPSLADQTHNLYLQTAAEIGVPGAVALVVLLVSFWIVGVRRLRTMERGVRRNILLGAIGATIAFAVDAFASPSWQFGQVILFFWLALGIGVACTREAIGPDRAPADTPVIVPKWVRRPAFALGVLGFAGLAPVAVMASRGYPSTVYNGISSIQIRVFPDPINAAQVAFYYPEFQAEATSYPDHPAGAPANALLPYTEIDPGQQDPNSLHYKLQLEVFLQSGDGGPITLDPHTTWRAVPEALAGHGTFASQPYAYPADNPPGVTFDYGNYGDFEIYRNTYPDAFHLVTIVASYGGQTASTVLNFTTPGTGGGAGDGGNPIVDTAVAGAAASGLLMIETARHHHDDKSTGEHITIGQTIDPNDSSIYQLTANLSSGKTVAGTPITMDAHTTWVVTDGDGYLKPISGTGIEEYHASPTDSGRTVTITVTYAGAAGNETETIQIKVPN